MNRRDFNDTQVHEQTSNKMAISDFGDNPKMVALIILIMKK